MLKSFETLSHEEIVANIPFKTIGELIDYELDQIVQEATDWADWFWEFAREYRTEDGVYSKFGTRVRKHNGGFQAVWFTNTRYIDKNTGHGKTRSTQLKKGLGFKYPKSTFKSAFDWEYDLCIRVENKYSQLRKRYDYLSKLRTAYNNYLNNIAEEKIQEEESMDDI